MNKISRKGFLKVAAAAAMSGVTAGALAACNGSSASSGSVADAIYTPGTYTATAKGMSEITATVTFDANTITKVELDLSGGTVVSELDTHGGFQGDGDTFVVMTFPQTDRPALEREMTGPYWHPLPLTDNLARVTYNLALGVDGEPFFPEVDQGCYYFRDRHSESQDPTDESGLFNRGSWNFTLAIYDSQTGTLYYYELDT